MSGLTAQAHLALDEPNVATQDDGGLNAVQATELHALDQQRVVLRRPIVRKGGPPRVSHFSRSARAIASPAPHSVAVPIVELAELGEARPPK